MTELAELIERMHDDGMTLRDVELPTREVVYFKSLIEAYPGYAAVHATPGAVRGERAQLIVATSRELSLELDGLLNDFAADVEAFTWKVSQHAAVTGRAVSTSTDVVPGDGA